MPARLSPQARAWLLAEIADLAERSPAAATRLVARLRAARQTLADHPGIGTAGLIPGTRRLIVGASVLTLRARGGDVEIAAIRHARQGDAHAPAEVTPLARTRHRR
jgi:plasmid stabilization system protein ParE